MADADKDGIISLPQQFVADRVRLSGDSQAFYVDLIGSNFDRQLEESLEPTSYTHPDKFLLSLHVPDDTKAGLCVNDIFILSFLSF